MHLAKYAKNLSGYSSLVLRLTIGVIFLMHGYQKLTGISGVESFFLSVGIPASAAWLVAGVEFVGGLMLIFGLFTRYASVLLSVVMAVAIFKVKIGNGLLGGAGGPGYELDLALLAGLLAILFLGPQKVSFDLDVLKKEF